MKKLVLKQSVIAVALTFGATEFALAQAPANAPVQSVYVTGSNLKRTDKEGTQPIQVITARDIKESGVANIAELIREIPAMGNDTNRDFDSGSGFARGVATASLRGLSSTATLILLNGRRMAPSAHADPNNGNSTLYDLNSIPMSAIERIEILKDGASAVYGSDAIGGVINFITKTDYQGASLSASTGMNEHGKFKTRNVNGSFGFGDLDKDGYNFMVTADFNQRDRVARPDVKDIHYDDLKELIGRFRTKYSSSISGAGGTAFYRESAPGSRNFGVTQATAPTRLIFKTASCPTDRLHTGSTQDWGILSTSILVGRTFCNFDVDSLADAVSDGEEMSLLSVGTMKLGQNHTAFAEAAFTRSDRDFSGAPITLGQTSVTNFTAGGVGTPFQAILEIGHPDNPFPTARASVGYRFENAKAGSKVVNDAVRFTTGVRGTVGRWNYETAFLFNRNDKDEINYGRLYLPTLRKLNTGTTLAALAADPTTFHDVATSGHSQIMSLDAKASTELWQMAGGASQLALGAEVRQDKVGLTPDARVAAGEIYGLANTIIDGKREVSSAYAEFRAPFLKNFEMDFAGRFDKYPGLKANFVPKVGAKWTVTPSLALRGTYQEAFRAPALIQTTPGGAQFFVSGIYDPKRCETDESTPKPGASAADCNKSASGTGGFNPDLKPETAKSYSLGLIFSPTNNFDFLLDLYKIRKEGEVALGDENAALKNEDKFPQNVIRDTNPVNFVTDANGNPIPGTGPLLMVKLPWTNQGAIEVQGMDVEFRVRHNLGAWGKLSGKLQGTYLHKYLLAEVTGDPEFNTAGGRAGIYDWHLNSGASNPQWKSSASVTWNYGVHATTLSARYVGPVSLLRVRNSNTVYPSPFCHYGTRKPTDAEQNRSTAIPLYEARFPECSVQSWTTFNLGYTYTGIKNLTMGIIVRNIFDTAAPFDAGNTTGGYNSALHNAQGRNFSISANYSFK